MTEKQADTTPDKDEPVTLTPRQVAEAISERLKRTVDPKVLRVFLRSTNAGVGSGKRYVFTEAEVPKLLKGFTSWEKEREEAKAKVKEDAKAAQTESDPTPPTEVEEKPKRSSRKAA